MNKRVVIRGLILPGGMDELDDYIGADYTSWLLAGFMTRSIIRQKKAGTLVEPVDIIGHSLGANAAGTMANALGDAGVEVGLVVMLDPTYRRTVRYGRPVAYQSRDWRASRITGATNISRPDLDHMGLTTDPTIIRFIKKNLSEAAR